VHSPSVTITRVKQTAKLQTPIKSFNLSLIMDFPDGDVDYEFLGWKFNVAKSGIKQTLKFEGLPNGTLPAIILFANVTFKVSIPLRVDHCLQSSQTRNFGH
jgi:hypothetical protein